MQSKKKTILAVAALVVIAAVLLLVWRAVTPKGEAGEKTITVQVSTYKADPIYKKRVAYFKKYKAHDEKQEAKVGDTVLIEETRHISKDKYFRLIKVVKRGEE